MKIKLIVTALLLGGHLYANAQTSVSDTIRSQHTFRLHNNTEVTESKTVVVTEEPAQKKKKFIFATPVSFFTCQSEKTTCKAPSIKLYSFKRN